MSVLPQVATFRSFFVVLLVFLAVTILLGINLSSFKRKQKLKFSRSFSGASRLGIPRLVEIPLSWALNYAISYRTLLWPDQERRLISDSQWIQLERPIGWDWLRFPILILHWLYRNSRIALTNIAQFCVAEARLPYVLWNRFSYRHSKFVQFRWSPVLLVVHIVRLLLIPLWTLLAIVIACYLVILDIFEACLLSFSC